jgi:hypothetical protein
MARNLKRTVLYEVIRQKYGKLLNGKKSGRSQSIKSLRIPFIKPKDDEKGPQQQAEAASEWPPKSQFSGFVPGRRALVIRYPVAGLLAVAFVLAVLIAFKLGQVSSAKEQQSAGAEVKTGQNNDNLAYPRADTAAKQAAVGQDSAAPAAEEEPLGPVGNHIIVIATYKQSEDLIFRKEVLITFW